MKLKLPGKPAAGEEKSTTFDAAIPGRSQCRSYRIPRMIREMGGRYMNQNSYFGFSESPFQDVPDQKFWFLTSAAATILTELAEFIKTYEGLALVSGGEGIGKTMLIAALVQRLPQSIHPIVISRPATEPFALIVNIAKALNIDIIEENLVDLTPLADAVHTAAQQGKFFVVIIDDAELLTDRHLDEIWILSQMELHGQHLLPIVLVGGKELEQKLGGYPNQHLRQLIHTRLSITGLTPEETIDYIDHRLGQVGSSFKACVAHNCSDQLFAITGGCPRRINQVLHQALERCVQENLPRITRKMLWEIEPENPQETQDLPKKRGLSKKVGAMAAAVLVMALAIYAMHNGRGIKAPLPATDISLTPLKDIPLASTAQIPSAPITAARPPEQDQTGPRAVGQPALSPPNLQASQTPEASQPLQEAGAVPAPQPGNKAAEPKTSTSTTYRLTPEDVNLMKVVAKHYSDNKTIGFVAIILANPQITDEDLIFPGQELFLPKVKPNGKVITLNDNQHYLLYNRYSDVSAFKKTVAKLHQRQVRFQHRQTHNIAAGIIYRIFLGGYEREDDLMNALTVAERR
jgi:type II secretory pathway predicted ATPase ExeA